MFQAWTSMLPAMGEGRCELSWNVQLDTAGAADKIRKVKRVSLLVSTSESRCEPSALQLSVPSTAAAVRIRADVEQVGVWWPLNSRAEWVNSKELEDTITSLQVSQQEQSGLLRRVTAFPLSSLWPGGEAWRLYKSDAADRSEALTDVLHEIVDHVCNFLRRSAHRTDMVLSRRHSRL